MKKRIRRCYASGNERGGTRRVKFHALFPKECRIYRETSIPLKERGRVLEFYLPVPQGAPESLSESPDARIVRDTRQGERSRRLTRLLPTKDFSSGPMTQDGCNFSELFPRARGIERPSRFPADTVCDINTRV